MNKQDIKIICLSTLLIVGSYIGFDIYRTCYIYPNRPILPLSVQPPRPARFALPDKSVSPAKEFSPRFHVATSQWDRPENRLQEFYTAVQKDPDGLGKAFTRFQEEPEYMQKLALLDDVLFRRYGVEKIKPASRTSEDGVNYIGDARKLAVLEKILNEPFRGTHTGKDVTTAPHFASAPYLLESYNNLSLNMEKIFLLHSEQGDRFVKSFATSSFWSFWGSDDTAKAAGIILSNALNIDLPAMENATDFIRNHYRNYGRLETILLLERLHYITSFSKERRLVKGLKKLAPAVPNLRPEQIGTMIAYGTSRTDYLISKQDGQIFFGLDYNDTLNGDKGDNVYLYRLYDGFDTIIEQGGNDTIYFSGHINPQDIKLDFDKADLFLTIRGDARHGIRIKDFMCGAPYQVETLRFTQNRLLNLPQTADKILKDNKKLRAEVDANKKAYCPDPVTGKLPPAPKPPLKLPPRPQIKNHK